MYIVTWDISYERSHAARKRFYRLLRRIVEESKAHLVQRSLLETVDYETARTVYEAAAELGDAKIYKVEG